MSKTELLLLYILGMIHSHVIVEMASLNKVTYYELKKAKTKTRMKRAIHCSTPRGWNILGSEWGCCGNYDGCCEYASIICYMHDAMCKCCGSPLCGPKCRPEPSCGKKEIHWNPGPKLEKTTTTTAVNEYVTDKRELMSTDMMMDEGRSDDKEEEIQQQAENKEDKDFDGEGSGEIPEQ